MNKKFSTLLLATALVSVTMWGGAAHAANSTLDPVDLTGGGTVNDGIVFDLDQDGGDNVTIKQGGNNVLDATNTGVTLGGTGTTTVNGTGTTTVGSTGSTSTTNIQSDQSVNIILNNDSTGTGDTFTVKDGATNMIVSTAGNTTITTTGSTASMSVDATTGAKLQDGSYSATVAATSAGFDNGAAKMNIDSTGSHMLSGTGPSSSAIDATSTSASVMYQDSSGANHGLTVNGTTSTLSGGTGAAQTSLSLGATSATLTSPDGNHSVAVSDTGTLVKGGASIYSGDSAGNSMIVDGTSARVTSTDGNHSVTVSDTGTAIKGGSVTNGGSASYSDASGTTGNSMIVDGTSARVTSANGSHSVTVSDTGTAIKGGSVTNGGADIYYDATNTGTHFAVGATGISSTSADGNHAFTVDNTGSVSSGGLNVYGSTGTTGGHFAVGATGMTSTSADGSHVFTVDDSGTVANGGFASYSGTGTSGNSMIVDSTSARVTSGDGSHSFTVSNAGAVTNGGADIWGGAGTGGHFAVGATGTTTTSGDGTTTLTVDNGSTTISTVNGADTNSIKVGATTSGTVNGGTFDYGTEVTGGMLITGDLGVNGSIYSLNPTASSGINVGENGLKIDGASNTVNLTADNDADTTNGRANLSMAPDQASLLVQNSTTGKNHGVAIGQNSTVVSGGTQSTSLTLTDGGATFRNDTTGGPARVTGVADGHSDYDAVNYRQLKAGYAGIAAVSALTAIPAPQQGKRFSIGLGYGNFKGQDAVAFGGQANVYEGFNVKAGLGFSDDEHTINVGVGYSW